MFKRLTEQGVLRNNAQPYGGVPEALDDDVRASGCTAPRYVCARVERSVLACCGAAVGSVR